METSIEKIGSVLGLFFLAFTAAVCVFLFIVYPAIFFVFTRQNPVPFMVKFIPTAMTAFGTGSSAASMPVTLECAVKAGIREDIAKFLVPLGCLLNMDGSAIELPMAVAFMGIAIGKELTVVDCLMLILTGFLATVGASPIPASGIAFYMTMMQTLDIPLVSLVSNASH